MILPDNPIEQKRDDKLNRARLAEKVAKMILSCSGKESFVIGIEGEWGSGKTSFVNLIIEELKDEVEVILFNPWYFENQKGLLIDFFSHFSIAIKNVLGEKLSKKVIGYTKKITSIDLGLSVGGVSVNPLRAIRSFFFSDKTLANIKKELNQSLSGIKKKIVITIDDIDRLDTKETKLVLKTVKLTADFPNTIFLLPYDRKNVEKKLNTSDDKTIGAEYLKKIIQVSFTLPNPDKEQLHQILFKELDKSIESVYGKIELTGENEQRWNSLFHNGLGALFCNIRDINRFISSLRLDWSIVGKKDVNIVDFMGITAVRVFAPRFYNSIVGNRELFLGPKFVSSSLRDEIEKSRKEEYNKLLTEEIDAHMKPNIDGIIKELFPVLATDAGFDGSIRDEWKKQKRICGIDNFGFYTQLGVPYGEISETEMEESLLLLSDIETFAKKLKNLHNEKRLRKFLTHILNKFDVLKKEDLKQLILSLWSLKDEIKDERSAVLDLDDFETQVSRITFHGIKKLIPENERAEFIKSLIQETDNSYFPVDFVSLIRSYFNEKRSRSYKPLLKEDDVKLLIPFALKKIHDLITQNKLEDKKYLLMFLYRLKDWDSEKAVTDFIKKLIETPDGLIKLLKGFTNTVLSTAGNYKQFEKSSLENLYDIKEIDEKVKNLDDDFVKNLSAEEKEALNLYINPPRDRWFPNKD